MTSSFCLRAGTLATSAMRSLSSATVDSFDIDSCSERSKERGRVRVREMMKGSGKSCWWKRRGGTKRQFESSTKLHTRTHRVFVCTMLDRDLMMPGEEKSRERGEEREE